MWLAYTDEVNEGNFVSYVTGEAPAWTNWYIGPLLPSGEPNNGGSNSETEECTAILPDHYDIEFKWGDVNCIDSAVNLHMYPICEHIPFW